VIPAKPLCDYATGSKAISYVVNFHENGIHRKYNMSYLDHFLNRL